MGLATVPARASAARATPPVAASAPVGKAVPTGRVFRSRVTARNNTVRDSRGQVWSPRPVGLGSWNANSSLLGREIAGTKDDALYQVTAWDVKWYRLVVPARATYRVRLLLTECYFSAPGRRVFDVKAEGRTVVRGIDVFRKVGAAHAYDVTFPVAVRDGELSLDFINHADLSALSAIEVVSTTPVPAAPAKRAVKFAPNSFWTTNISKAPLASNSRAVVANLVRTVKDRYGGIGGFNAFEYNASFHVVSARQRRITLGFYNCQRKSAVPSGLFNGSKHYVGVPVPADAVPARGTDGAMTIYSPSSDQLWEFWQMRRNPRSGAWEACWGGRMDAVSKGAGSFPEWFGASASGLPMAGGMITIDEARRGEINHAVGLGVVEARAWPAFSWPARRTDGGTYSSNVVMEGQRLRLDPKLNLDTYQLTPVGRMVAKAAQKYGFIVTDRSGIVGVGTESGRLLEARTGVNPWRRILVGPSWAAMRDFPWDKLQVLPKDYGRPIGRD